MDCLENHTSFLLEYILLPTSPIKGFEARQWVQNLTTQEHVWLTLEARGIKTSLYTPVYNRLFFRENNIFIQTLRMKTEEAFSKDDSLEEF